MTLPTKTKAERTPKQRAFLDCWDGNINSTAEKANISISYAKVLWADPEIKKLIRRREQNRTTKSVANRIERQEFWTKVLLGEETSKVITIDDDGVETIKEILPKMSDRLKASELLGRSEADFTDNQRISDPDGKSLTWKVEIVDPEDKEN